LLLLLFSTLYIILLLQTFPTLFLNLLFLSYVILVDCCSLAAIMQWSGSTSRIFTMGVPPFIFFFFLFCKSCFIFFFVCGSQGDPKLSLTLRALQERDWVAFVDRNRNPCETIAIWIIEWALASIILLCLIWLSLIVPCDR